MWFRKTTSLELSEKRMCKLLKTINRLKERTTDPTDSLYSSDNDSKTEKYRKYRLIQEIIEDRKREIYGSK